MYCQNCGTAIPAMGKFCPECGTPVRSESDATSAQDAQTQSNATGANNDNTAENTVGVGAWTQVYGIGPTIFVICEMLILCTGAVLLSGFEDIMLQPIRLLDYLFVIVAVSVIGLIALLTDLGALSRLGVHGAWKWWILIPPVYFFMRASKTSRKYVLAIVQLALTIAMVLLSSLIVPTFFSFVSASAAEDTEAPDAYELEPQESWLNSVSEIQPTAEVSVQPTPNVTASAGRHLTVGDESPSVRLLQQRLIDLGYLATPANGYFDETTKAALQSIQERAGLNTSGAVDDATWDLLFSGEAEQYAIPTATPNATFVVPSSRPTERKAPVGFDANGFVFADSSERYLTDSDLSGLSQEMLGFARNEIFARNGNIFQKDKYKNHYESYAWYRAIPNKRSGVNPEDLSTIEQSNIKLIQAYENGNRSESTSVNSVEEAMAAIRNAFYPYVGDVVFHDVEYSPQTNYYYFHLSVAAWHPDGDYAYDNGEPGDAYGYLDANTGSITVGDNSLEGWGSIYGT